MSEEHLTELGEYSLHVNGGAVMSTVPVVAQNTLDISKDDDATVYLDAANDAVILRFNEEE